MTSRSRPRGMPTLAAMLLAAATVAIDGLAADRPTPLGVVRAEVEQAVRDVTAALDFQDRSRAVHRLIELRHVLEADPRLESSVVVRGFIRRVDRGLVLASRDLAVVASDTASPPRGAAGGRRAEAAALIDLIQATVRPEAWDVNGGTGSIVYFANGHGLVVVAPDDVHDDVGDLLRQLR